MASYVEDSISAEGHIKEENGGVSEALLMEVEWKVWTSQKQADHEPILYVTFGEDEEESFKGRHMCKDDISQLKQTLLDILYLNPEFMSALNPVLLEEDYLRGGN